MKKIIDIPETILQELKILAVKSNKDLKNFIQDVLISLVKTPTVLKKPKSGGKNYRKKE